MKGRVREKEEEEMRMEEKAMEKGREQGGWRLCASSGAGTEPGAGGRTGAGD